MDWGKVVFVGNCQIAAMWRIYVDYLPDELKSSACYVDSAQTATPESLEACAGADRLVVQMTEFAQRIGEIESDAMQYRVPLVLCRFLWPYSGVDHPRNVGRPFLPGGPYPSEFGDEFLNDHIAAGTDPRVAAHIYLESDVAAARRVDRLAKLNLEQQSRRDAACGDYQTVAIIDRLLSVEPLFRSRGHLKAPLVKHLAEVLFTSMNADADFLSYLAGLDFDRLSPLTEVPVHPSVARTFGMGFIDAQSRYLYLDEGRFTFFEWAERYMKCEWNEAFHEAVHLYWQGRVEESIALWEGCMENSLWSATGREMLAGVLVRAGRPLQAVRWMREAAAIEPGNARYAALAKDIALTAQARRL